jgi:hypothetical protein
VLEGLSGTIQISELYRKHGISAVILLNMYCFGIPVMIESTSCGA